MKVTLIGAGRQGTRRLQAIQEAGEDTVVIVADPDGRAGRVLACSAGCRWTPEWLEAVEADADAVLVCSPPDGHAEITLEALRRGRHVLCEKPLALTVAAAGEMVAAADAVKRTLKCGFNYRHHPGITLAHVWVSAGRVGRVVALHAVHGTGGRPQFEREWRTQRDRSGGGILLDQGVHVLDLFRWFGGPFEEVVGAVSTAYWPIAPVEDNAFAVLRADGLLATLHVSWTQWKNRFSLEVVGTDGVVAVEGLGGSYGAECVIVRPTPAADAREEDITEFRGADTSWREEWREFKAAIAGGREPLGSGRDGIEALALAEAIYRSSEAHRAIACVPADSARPGLRGGVA